MDVLKRKDVESSKGERLGGKESRLIWKKRKERKKIAIQLKEDSCS